MELDNTRITIRERGLLETLDLALHVLREFAQPWFFMTLAAVVPLWLLNHYLIGWMVDPQIFDYTEYQLYEWAPAEWHLRIYYMFPWRYLFDLALLTFIEAPLASIFVTAYLGEAVFMQKPTYRQVFLTVLRHLPALILCQLLLRGIGPALLLAGFIDRYSSYTANEVMLWLIAAYSAGFRIFRPYINEIILLEKNPLRSRSAAAITVNRRSAHLHGSSSGNLFVRWLLAAMQGLLLVFLIMSALYLGVGLLISHFEMNWYFAVLLFPAGMWIVVGYFSVVRYLDYLDLRIRYEGWEVELLMRAEAARLAGKVW